MALRLTAAHATIQGGRRAQEDSALLWPGEIPWHGREGTPRLPDGHLLAVLGDGMGGHIGGAMASDIATSTFTQTFCDGYLPGVLMERFIMTLDTANAALQRKVDERPHLSGMGTTLIGALIAPYELGSALSWISVGDSLLYLWRRGDLARLNEDHSLAPELDKLAEAGKISWDEAQADPRRHYLRSALTGADIEMIDVTPRPLPLAADDIVVVASDGIHTLDNADIARLISDARDNGAAAVAEALVRAVEARGLANQDNTTVLAVLVGDDTA